MIEKKLQRIREGARQRQDAINEINFTYKGLHSLSVLLIKRMGPPLAPVLEVQFMEDRSVRSDLRRVSIEYGHVPQPCVCEEASHLLGEVLHMERARTGPGRLHAVLAALLGVRAFLLRMWSHLIHLVPEEDLPEFRKEAIALQNREADQHRQLLALERRLTDGDRMTA